MSPGLSARHWKNGRLQDLVFFQRGFDITQAQQTPGPYPVISSSGVTSHHSEFKATGPGVGDVPIYGSTGINGFHNKAKVTGPGVVTGRSGTLGKVHYIRTGVPVEWRDAAGETRYARAQVIDFRTQAEVKVFILDNLWTALPRPPFTDEETEAVANRVYDFVWQQSASGRDLATA